MDDEFWQNKWANNEIGFHEKEVNPILFTHFKTLNLPQGSRIFLPLCGKSLDMAWLISQGHRVVGAELCEIAIDQLFQELGVRPIISRNETYVHYGAPSIDIFVGDIFNLSEPILGEVDAIYDRAALVALPEELRGRYASHVNQITKYKPQLMVSFNYDQALLAGPPFSISREEIQQNYGPNYKITFLETKEVVGGLKGKCEAQEYVWLLEARSNYRNTPNEVSG